MLKASGEPFESVPDAFLRMEEEEKQSLLYYVAHHDDLVRYDAHSLEELTKRGDQDF